MIFRVGILGLFLLMPLVTQAGLSINEIAWMGSLESANDEWIELYNSGSEAIDVSGWTLEDGKALAISLSGNIDSGSFTVLERTDDGSASGQAFLIYTGALPNTGGTLVLRDDQGTIVDQVAGGENWENIGGDNTTKETAQYTSNGWVTGEATPGGENITSGTADTGSQKRSSSGSNPVVVKKRVVEPSLKYSEAELTLDISVPEMIYVNQPVKFVAVPDSIGETIMDSLQYEWNFGDLNTASGKSVTHTYAHPGEYIVSLRSHYARHDSVIQMTLTVLPVRLVLASAPDGDVFLHNESPYNLDLSGYTLSGNKSIKFPKYSFVPAKGTVTIDADKFGGYKLGQVQLFDQGGVLLAVTTTEPEGILLESATLSESYSSNNQVLSESIKTSGDFSFNSNETEVESGGQTNPTKVDNKVEVPATSLISGDKNLPADTWPIVGLLGIIALGVVGVVTGSQKREV